MASHWILAGVLLLQAQAQPAFRSEVRLIVQPVTVTGRDGRAIAGLTAADFTVTEDGKPQQIAFVEYQAIESAPAVRMQPPARSLEGATASAVAAVPGDPRYRGRRLLVFYFDLYRSLPDDHGRGLGAAGKFV